MAQIVFPRVKWLPLLMGLFSALSAALPYFLAAGMKQVQPFIPFIRHSAAYPPQSGIFSIFITVAGILGIPTFLLRYVVVKHRDVLTNEKGFNQMNRSSLIMGFLLLIALVYTSHNPLGFREANKQSWISNILVPHHIGALAICLFFNVYILIQTYITYRQKRIAKNNVFIHAVLAICVVISTWTAVFPLAASLKDMLRTIEEDEIHGVSLEYKDYSFYSIICALSEWSFTFFGLLFIVSFYTDLAKVKLRAELKPKRTTRRSFELSSPVHKDDDETTKV